MKALKANENIMIGKRDLKNHEGYRTPCHTKEATLPPRHDGNDSGESLKEDWIDGKHLLRRTKSLRDRDSIRGSRE